MIRGIGRSANNAEETGGSKKQLQFENENLQREVMKWRREAEHSRDEKRELEASFRRLDQEIGNGYHLAERKEKELRIAELVAKTQKMSHMLEKELHSHDDLRRVYTELQGEDRKLKEQVELLNRVVDSVETKHATLISTHATLTASYEAAQATIEKLQGEVLVLQEKLASSDTHTQLVADYEEKIRSWERSCRELEYKCEHKTQKLTQTQQIANAAQEDTENALQRQAVLEQELSNVHDLVIRTNAAMRTMEAKVEANLKAAQYGANQEALNRRVRHLEGELLEKNQVNADLMQTCNQLLGSQKLELLGEQTGARAFSEYPDSATSASTKKKKFTPFRVTSSPMKMNGNQYEEDSDNQMHQLVMLAADPNDNSGASYLNRSKINAFLEVIQSRAARKKFKTLLIGKLAECLNKLREMAHRSASESAVQLASNQMLQREVAELQRKLKSSQADNRSDALEGTTMTMKVSSDATKTRDFLLRVVDVYAEKQQQDDHRQMTFLTQPLSSDMLIIKGQNGQDVRHGIPDDRLCLRDCQLDDGDVGQLLLKVLVSGVRFREILLDSNSLSDDGAQHVADFVEKTPPSVRMISLTGNKRITKRGIDYIRRGLVRNQRVQRFEEVEGESKDELILRGLAIQEDFDISGNATETIRVVLPTIVHDGEPQASMDPTTIEAVDAMTEKLRQLGFTYNIRQPLTTRPRSASYGTKSRVPIRPKPIWEYATVDEELVSVLADALPVDEDEDEATEDESSDVIADPVELSSTSGSIP
ncbi:hypothetical protein BBJ29_005282 [Phytophthora kernoviae]|uniref:Uncharacterized protein n=1 Tax=Phytophthora kernoviae TaxID=325452 RepID=A0A3R7KI96_9STRA|nr:hypothetical protein BBJ29_005282 [Phytophthora kernoviae]